MCRAGGGEGIREANHKAIRGAKGNNQLRVSEEQSGGPDGKELVEEPWDIDQRGNWKLDRVWTLQSRE